MEQMQQALLCFHDVQAFGVPHLRLNLKQDEKTISCAQKQ